MSLFKFEMRKLLVNKRTLIMLAALFILYAAVGFFTSYYGFGNQDNYTVYSELAENAAGPLNEQQAADSEAAYEAAKDRYGDNSEAISHVSAGDPILKFNVDYAEYATDVDDYYDGASTDDASKPYGINTLQEKINTLEQSGDTSSFEYNKTVQQLEIETELGEPVYENTSLWKNLFDNWGGFLLITLLFIPLAFIIAPVFSVEASTGMDNLVLSSKHGRKKIVTAKLATVVITSAVVVLIYLAATFFTNFLALGSFAGATAPLRSVSTFVRAPLGISVWQFSLVATAWLVFMGTVYGILMAFLSSNVKNQMTAFGIGIGILLGNMAIGALGANFTTTIQPVLDFGLTNLIRVTTIFKNFSVYNIFGMAVPYYAVAIGLMVLLCGIGIWAIYRSQKKRTAA